MSVSPSSTFSSKQNTHVCMSECRERLGHPVHQDLMVLLEMSYVLDLNFSEQLLIRTAYLFPLKGRYWTSWSTWRERREGECLLLVYDHRSRVIKSRRYFQGHDGVPGARGPPGDQGPIVRNIAIRN